MVFNQGRNYCTVRSFLVCGISNALDGSEDDMASSDIPSVDSEHEDEEDDSSDNASESSDVDDLGNPFSDNEDFSDEEN